MVYVDIAHVDVESVSEELVQEPLSDVAQARAPAVWQKIVGLVPVIYAEVSWFWLTQEKNRWVSFVTISFVIQR